MSAPGPLPATQRLAEFIAGLHCEHLPAAVRSQMGVLLIDFFRVAAVGAGAPWVAKLRNALAPLGGAPLASVLLSDERTDPVRAAYLNGVISGSLDWDDTHVGAMLHPGVVVWPAVLAIGEMTRADGRALTAAAVAGYETMIRVGLSVQPGHFRRGFQSTPTCGVFGAAAAAAKLLGLGVEGTRDALAIAASYAGGTTQFYLSGSEVKRLHAGKASAGGVEAALLAHAGLTGPRDAIEGEQGFARALADAFDARAIEEGLGTEFRLEELTLKPHAGSARLQAAVEAACELARRGASPPRIEAVEIGIPAVIEGRLTNNDPQGLQQAQMSVPFAVAMALTLAPGREWPPVLTLDDFQRCLDDARVRELARRCVCVRDAEIERATTAEHVPARVTVRLADGRRLEHAVWLPPGSPRRPLSAEEISARFRAVVAPLVAPADLDAWLARARAPEALASVHELLALRRASAVPTIYGNPMTSRGADDRP
ncbi:MAG: MmgE/PrpD family protein [Betaproteobacteria bacterium]|nr:MmgE/PrpD family protein [Betaproteobacteria bacterium]